METSQLLIQANGAVPFRFGAFVPVRTVGTVLALVEFLRSAVTVSSDWYRTQEMKFFYLSG